jgi:hypothetical protein
MGKIVFVPRADAPGSGLTLGEAAAELGVVPAQLMEWIRDGSLPAPNIVRGRFVFSFTYALSVRCNGIRIPGTYSNALPTYRQRKAMIAEAKRGGKPHPGGRPKGSKDKKPRANYRKGGAK